MPGFIEIIFLKLDKKELLPIRNYFQDTKSSRHLLLLTFILFIQYVIIVPWKTNTNMSSKILTGKGIPFFISNSKSDPSA